MEVIRHGKYKSAVEPFLENKMSDANREQVTALLNSSTCN
jgi:protease-4